MSLFQDLKNRGLLQDYTDNLEDILDKEKPAFYLGADPTADSLHVGHFLGYITARRLADNGLRPVLIVGGGTGRIGDPKPNAERTLLDDKEIEKNISKISKQVQNLLHVQDLTVVNNYDWLSKLNLIDFLRDIGKYFTVNNLIKKDAIAERLKTDIGLSYTEFAYPLLQATDYLELFKRYNCRLQMGGSDQWGNIVAGVDLIRKKENATVGAMTFPLLVDKSTGKKFGKTEGNAIWLDPNKTTPFAFYQFFLNTTDAMVKEMLLKLTLLTVAEIEDIISKWQQAPHERYAQKVLATEVTAYVHGSKTAHDTKKASDILFGDEFNKIDIAVKDIIIKEAPSYKWDELQDLQIIDLLVKTNLASSKREAKEFLSSNAIKLFSLKIDEKYKIKEDDFKDGLIILKRGKKNLAIIYK